MSKLPVLVLAYNRPDLTEGLMKKVAAYAPDRLYVACDGARASKAGDHDLVEATRFFLTSPSWRTEIHTRLLPSNQGARHAVEGAIDWFFNNESEGIIFEDDCHPSRDFFHLAEHVIDRYRANQTVWGMTGSNDAGLVFPNDCSYGFLSTPLTWGWATWANRWKMHDVRLLNYPKNRRKIGLGAWPSRAHKLGFQRHIDSMLRSGTPEAWDYRWSWSVMSHGGLWIVSRQHLVKNVGFRPDATNTSKRWLVEQPLGRLGRIKDPICVQPNRDADWKVLQKIHGVAKPLWLNYPILFLKFVKKKTLRAFGVQ